MTRHKNRPARPAVHEQAQKGQGAKSMSTQITALNVECMGIEGVREGGNNDGGSRGPNEGPVLVGERIKWNITPTPDIRENTLQLVRPGTKIPLILVRYGYDDEHGNEVQCNHGNPNEDQPDGAGAREDPFDLESYEVKNERDTGGPGTTPVTKLNAPLGPGTKRVWMKAILWAGPNGEWNGGLTVRSNKAYCPAPVD